MNILYYDCLAGISGDMNLAAMIDLGVEPDYLCSELDKLGLGGEFELLVSRDERNGIHGTRVDVRVAGQPHDPGHRHDPEHEHAHGFRRDYSGIKAIIMNSALADEVKETSGRIFRRLAEAEAKVHGKSVDEVHFHEVGAVDSIVDVVGAAICFHRLGVDEVWASPVELGSGFVRCAHGVIPVPAPATVEILHGIPTTRGGTDHEATTPTGAAILAVLADEFSAAPAMTTMKTGHGIGHRETERPNLLRVHLAAADSSRSIRRSRARLLQCNIDDMTGEMLGDALELLREKGAMDVHFSCITMKKNRPAAQISLLCGEHEEVRFTELLFRHTTTLGVKSFALEKAMLERRFETLETPLGPVTMKRALLDGKVLRSKPEFEECKAMARRHGIPLAEVYALIGKLE
jgi:uncharacterized protein (TIGR00299 family) protein